MLDHGATAWATGGVYVIYTWRLPEIGLWVWKPVLRQFRVRWPLWM